MGQGKSTSVGRGSMRELKPNVWELRISTGKDPLTGKYRTKSKTFRGTKTDAQKKLTKLLAEYDSGIGAGSNATFEQVLRRWWAVSEITYKSANSRLDIKRIIDRVLIPSLGYHPINKLRPEYFEALYAELFKQAQARGEKGTRVIKVHNVCKKTLRMAERYELIARSPLHSVAPPVVKSPKVKDRLVPLETVKEFLADIEAWNNEYGRLFFAKLMIGARRGEMLGLQRRDIDDKAMTLDVVRQVVEDEETHELYVKDNKAGSMRTVGIDDFTLALLRAQEDFVVKRAEELGAELKPTAFLWTDDPPGAIPWRPNRVTTAWSRRRKDSGLTMRPHDLRHLNGTHLSKLGVELAVISARLGHSRHSTTADFYIDNVTGDNKAASALLAKAVTAKAKKKATKKRAKPQE